MAKEEEEKTGKPELAKIDYGRPLIKPGSLPHHEIDTFHLEETIIEKESNPKSWSNCDATTFEVRRGPDYVSGQKQPSKKSLYTVFAVDGYHMPKKVNAVHRFCDIEQYIKKHTPDLPSKLKHYLPPLIVINVMVPDYEPEMMGAKTNGEGWGLIVYAHLSEEIVEQLKEFGAGKVEKLSPALQLLSGFIHASNDSSPLRQRFKCIARIMNLSHTSFNYLTKSMVSRYNGKPFLARTSSTFYHEPGRLFAIDIDAHLFGYPARKGLSYVKGNIESAIYDVGFVIEGHTNEELPEQILCCCRVSKMSPSMAKEFPKEFIDFAYTKEGMRYWEKHRDKKLLQGHHAATQPVLSHTDGGDPRNADDDDPDSPRSAPAPRGDGAEDQDQDQQGDGSGGGGVFKMLGLW